MSIRNDLYLAANRCYERRLVSSAMFAYDLASSCKPDSPSNILVTDGSSNPETSLEYDMAKSRFDCKMFESCAELLLPRSDANIFKLSHKSLFLALYARFMAGEKKANDNSERTHAHPEASDDNNEIPYICSLLAIYFGTENTDPQGDGFLKYLYGMVLARSDAEDEAVKWLLESVKEEPINLEAWQELKACVGSVKQLQGLKPFLPVTHFMTAFFYAAVCQEVCYNADYVHKQLTDLESIFPSSHWLKTQRALLFYHTRDYQAADNLFSQIIQEAPYTLHGLDQYSNMLYVLGDGPKLAFLAQLASATDKFRPETCCIVGNYFSLKSEHEKAIQYFRRALLLDRHYLQAWTLMGHEFIELKNTHAAIDCYRRAVDVDRKDYRAWYGLGQAYEILEMHSYALYYYRRATILRPFDPKIWHAVGKCYDNVGNPSESIKAYKRALAVGTLDTSSTLLNSNGSTGATILDAHTTTQILYNLSRLYEQLGDLATAMKHMELVMGQEDMSLIEDAESEESPSGGIGVTLITSQARLWLARRELTRNNYRRATDLAHELCNTGFEVEEAKAIIREATSRMEAVDGNEVSDERSSE